MALICLFRRVTISPASMPARSQQFATGDAATTNSDGARPAFADTLRSLDSSDTGGARKGKGDVKQVNQGEDQSQDESTDVTLRARPLPPLAAFALPSWIFASSSATASRPAATVRPKATTSRRWVRSSRARRGSPASSDFAIRSAAVRSYNGRSATNSRGRTSATTGAGSACRGFDLCGSGAAGWRPAEARQRGFHHGCSHQKSYRKRCTGCASSAGCNSGRRQGHPRFRIDGRLNPPPPDAPSTPSKPVEAAVPVAAAPPKPPAQPLKDLSLDMTQPGAQKVEVRLVQQAGELHVAVRTGDWAWLRVTAELAEAGGPAGRNGFRTEAWRPGASATSGMGHAMETRSAASSEVRRAATIRSRMQGRSSRAASGPGSNPTGRPGWKKWNRVQERVMASAVNPITGAASTAASTGVRVRRIAAFRLRPQKRCF